MTSIKVRVESRNRGPVADVDYDLEPYRVIPDGQKGVANSKPVDDLETARSMQRANEQF